MNPMKTSFLIAALVATSAAAAFAGPGPAYQGQAAASRDLPAATVALHCTSMSVQTPGGKTPATGMNCTQKSVNTSAVCRAHCG